MCLSQHAEESKAMRAIAEKIGFNSTHSLTEKTFNAMRDNCSLNKEMRIKLNDATKFFSGSVTVRNECFHLWVQVHRLDQKVDTSRLRSLATGTRALKESVFEAWAKVVGNKKSAMARWTNGTLLWVFGAWAQMVHEIHDFEGQLNKKLGGTLLAQGKVLRGIIFYEWLEVMRKRKKALKRWTHSALVHMFKEWAGLCAERWELYAQVQEKCKGVAARLKGAWRDICFHAWSNDVLKDRRARARFANSTLYMCLSSWKGLTRAEKRNREVLANIKMRIDRRGEILVFQAYANIVAERVHMKKVLQNILKMWIDKGRRVGFRSLYIYNTRRKRHREIVAQTLSRIERFRQRVAFVGVCINRDQEVRVRVTLVRMANRPAGNAYVIWIP